MIDFRKFGGVLYVRDGGDARNPDDVLWNFGIMGQPGIQGPCIPVNAPALYDVAPYAEGKWDGKSDIIIHQSSIKALGKFQPAQQQPRGTCGGRTGKRAAQHLQCNLIAAGKAASYKPVSHAWLYALARMEYGMLGGGDGVPDGSIPLVMNKYGLLHVEESGDTNDYGDGSDDLAARWGGRNGPPKELFDKAADNKVESTLVKVRSIQEMMDGYAIGGVGLVSSMRGFDMTRDSKGRCGARGQWAHYMTGSGGKMIDGRLWVLIDQSWGKNVPDGPVVEGCPDYTFAADRDVVERDMIQGGSWHIIFNFPLWDERKVINWLDI